jgi:iron transport multicopper oxidase
LKGQYPEGLRAPFIIRDPDMPFTYDEEISLPISDWYHTPMPELSAAFLSITNPSGAEPVPDATLLGDTQNTKVKISPGKTYFIRLVNMGAFAAQRFWIEGHTMRVVEVDGTFTEPKEANVLYLAVAQRMSILVTAKNDTGANFPIMASMDEVCVSSFPFQRTK